MEYLNQDYSFTKAEYSEQLIDEYKGNPLIEALPPIYSTSQAYEKMCINPLYSEHERELSSEIRYQMLFRLQQFFQPVSKHLDLEKRFSRLLRTGYITRNPLSVEEVKHLRGYKVSSVPAASSFTFMGFSGIGKTTAMEQVLSLYPKVILHTYPVNRIQIVWLKLNCPHDGSLKTLCFDFFMKVDELTGKNYFSKYAKKSESTSRLIIQMGRVARLHCIGALIIDEIQHLISARKSEEKEKMMNFFVTLINEIGIPIILIGTMKAKSILQLDFRQARRGSGQGDIVWEQMKPGDDWDMLIEEMWKYQWTKQNTPLSPELKWKIYEESQGIVDVAVKLYSLAQSRAIETGNEKITPRLIEIVAKEDLKLIQPMLKALKNGIYSEILQYEDIVPLNLSKFLEERKSKIDLRATIQKHKEQQEKEKAEFEVSVIEKVIHALISLGTPAKEAEKAVTKIIIETKEENPQNVLKMSLEYLKEKDESKQQQKKMQLNSASTNCLQKLIDKGKKDKLSAYEALIKGDYIKNPRKEFML